MVGRSGDAGDAPVDCRWPAVAAEWAHMDRLTATATEGRRTAMNLLPEPEPGPASDGPWGVVVVAGGGMSGRETCRTWSEIYSDYCLRMELSTRPERHAGC